MNNQVQFDLGSEFEGNYKSCFARSVAVNSQYKQTKSLDFIQPLQDNNNAQDVSKKPCAVNRPLVMESQEVVRLRKNARNSLDDTRRFSGSIITSNRRASICSSRLSEIPVENIMSQSKIETLQWQLKEIQKSREMYQAVMKQVVTFLEKAHHSLELLGNRINRKNSVPRSKSEHQILNENSNGNNDTSTLTPGLNMCMDDYMAFKDFTRRLHKEEEPSPEEIPPEKLAKEAFRLLRTAQSLLNTREPDLAQVSNQPENDIEFLAQLAKEFPTPDHKPQRTTSFSLSPKLILPETEVKISTAFNRKLSLQLSEVKRNSVSKQMFKNVDSARGSVAESDTEFPNDNGVFNNTKNKSEKSTSPATGSISSVEDESGFSSMNSFQEVGLPTINSTMTDEVCTKNALLRSMLHNNTDYSSLNLSLEQYSSDNTVLSNNTCNKQVEQKKTVISDYKLWQKPSSSLASPQHKRWNSTPSEEIGSQSLKVLWV
ncbi:uncharacterized protein LOC108908223 [Anoplophora glabripennis]|uniref:uncharacterized protein LOC108908223 n=1 Tax=Anoplophora glabripennis TaxID=217634 RepID=UPI0008750026|nr:uncharacterized protein LOC108908223 [Anoplophora glabripennis]